MTLRHFCFLIPMALRRWNIKDELSDRIDTYSDPLMDCTSNNAV